jgi:hypothetical protein
MTVSREEEVGIKSSNYYWNILKISQAVASSNTGYLQGKADLKCLYTDYTQKNCAILEVNKKFISHLTWAQRTPSAVATVQVSHALPAVRFSCLLRGRGASFQDDVTGGKGFLCAPF